MEVYFDLIPYDIYGIILEKLDNKDVYQLLKVLPSNFHFDFIDLPSRRLTVKIPGVETADMNIWNKFLSGTKAVIGGSYVVSSVLQEEYDASDIDIYINFKYKSVLDNFLEDSGVGYHSPNPKDYFAISGQDVKLPRELYRLYNLDIVLIDDEYNPADYLRKITDFTILRSFIIYGPSGVTLKIDDIDNLFNKRLVLNHDKKIKYDRYYKYIHRGFTYVSPTDTADEHVIKYLSLMRSFVYPTILLVNDYSSENLRAIWGTYPKELVNKLSAVVPVGCRGASLVDDWNQKIFNYLILSYTCYISVSDAWKKSVSLLGSSGDSNIPHKSIDEAAIYVIYSRDGIYQLLRGARQSPIY